MTNGNCTTNITGISATVTVNANPTAVAGSNTPCPGTNINLTETGIGGTVWSWSGPGGTFNVQNPVIPNASGANIGTYIVTVTNAQGCTASAQTTVILQAEPTAAPTNNGPICEGSTLNLMAGSGGTMWSWSGPGSFSSPQQNPNIPSATLADAGTYTVTVTNGFGCTDEASTSVVVNATPMVLASSNSPVCSGIPLGLMATGTSGVTWSWTGPNGFTSSSQNPNIPSPTTLASGAYSVVVTVTATGCTETSSTAVIVNDSPVVGASSNSPVCEGAMLNLAAAERAVSPGRGWDRMAFSVCSNIPSLLRQVYWQAVLTQSLSRFPPRAAPASPRPLLR
ncbi:MAG: immunoglobulin domain-containing protein [Saprospiraceae bacterium]|nr:immunoglobulin domain-containing protein [Saprospiraceae bacterium]